MGPLRWSQFVLAFLVCLGAASLAAAPGVVDLEVKEYLDLRARCSAVTGKSLVEIRRAAASLRGRVIELRGQISGIASPVSVPESDRPVVSFLLQTPDDSIFVEAIENEPEVRVGNRVAVLARVPVETRSLQKLEMLAVAETDRLPTEMRGTDTTEVVLPRLQRRDQPGPLPPELGRLDHRPEEVEVKPPRREAESQRRRIETWKSFVASYNPDLTDAQQELIVRCVLGYSAVYNIDHRLTFAMIRAESDFHPRCRSHAGAMGLAQLMPFTCDEYGITDPYDIQQSIWGGCRELGGYLRKHEGLANYDQFSLSMACYNAGSGAVRKYGGIPPYRETINYIKTVGKLFVKLVRDGYP